ncbi:MAG TPA: hypothetical protein VFI69_09440 [Candidatus Limnocylindrales bacterium]|nr:hypothetical protein [Candidatus Limnocylindrales bacterium]
MNDWVCDNCKSINRASAASCYSCGGVREVVDAREKRDLANAGTGLDPMPAGEGLAPSPSGGSGVGAFALSGAAPGGLIGDTSSAIGAFTRPTSAGPAGGADVLGGLLVGALAAIVASAVWYGVVAVTNYQVGIVAIAVGFLVGQGVVLGARRHGHVALVAISVVLTLLALAISEYLIVVHIVNQELAAEGASVDVIQPLGLVVEVITESLKAEPLTLVFWAIALFQAFIIPARMIGDLGRQDRPA